MKNILLLICLLFTIDVYADQLACLSKERAEKAVKFLKGNNVKEAISWCECCTEEPKVKIVITKVHYRHTGYENF